ncbi:MAG: hypothetical protein EPN97_10810 [Alphaproteobacteria bacterium]|nr:MAG: hypothetical protein EPN97_10810 [Alphaproteobacteria bacterium]
MAAENEIHLTCLQCSTIYRLNPLRLGAGIMVRCSQCRQEWYQGAPDENGLIPPPLDAPPSPPPAPAPEPAAPEATAPPDWMKDEPKDDVTFRPTTKGEYFLEDDMRVLPESVMPTPVKPGDGADMSAITHRPLGMGAAAYGVFIFAFLFCLTFSGLLLGKHEVMKHYPQMLSVYDALHVGVEAPGQGLALSEMIAENRVEKGARTLAVEAKLANISDHPLARPSFRVTVRNTYGKSLDSWDFISDKDMIPSGQSVPVKMTFRDAPQDAKTAELAVTGD